MSSPVRAILHGLEATTPAALTDDLLEEIFLRVAAPADLARASTACPSFRRLITDPSFLRRYRSIHPTLLLGFIDPFGFHPAEAPHPSAPAARAFASAANCSFDDYLPRGRGFLWYPLDVRDGRVLLRNVPDDTLAFPDHAVCDPLSGRHLLLPPIHNELFASVQAREQNLYYFELFFAPSGDDEEETTFRVMFPSYCVKGVVVFVFSSGSGCWSVGASSSWDAPNFSELPDRPLLRSRCHCAYGCFYWEVVGTEKLLKLDMNRMEFSIVDHPPFLAQRNIVIVEAGEGRLGVVCPIKTNLYYATWQNEGERTNEWQMEKLVPLPVHHKCYIVAASERYIFVQDIPEVGDKVPKVCFSIEIKTLKIERVSQNCMNPYDVKPYFGYPPFMSPRRI